VVVDSPSDEGMRFQNIDGGADACKSLRSDLRGALEQELDDTFEVGECLFGIDHSRHGAGLGRVALRRSILFFEQP
jgi:hypothetical protein